MLSINSSQLDQVALADGRRCRGRGTLQRLGYNDETQLVRLHDAYHRTLRLIAIPDGSLPDPWKNMEAAHTAFVQAILKTRLEEKQRQEQSFLPPLSS